MQVQSQKGTIHLDKVADAHEDMVTDMLALKFLESLVTAGMDGEIAFWDLTTLRKRRSLRGHKKVFSPGAAAAVGEAVALTCVCLAMYIGRAEPLVLFEAIVDLLRRI